MFLQFSIIHDLKRKLQKVMKFPWRYMKNHADAVVLHGDVGPPAVQHQLDQVGVILLPDCLGV